MVYIVAGLKSTAQMGAVDFKHTSLCVSEPLYPVPALTPCLSVCLSIILVPYPTLLSSPPSPRFLHPHHPPLDCQRVL